MKKKSKRIFCLLSFIFSLFFSINAQTIITLQPNAEEGKDAFLLKNKDGETTNYGSDYRMWITAGTNTGIPNFVRSLIDFDLTQIPEGATIIKAELTLFYEPISPYNNYVHRGDAAFFLQRITSNWEEHTVTWASQPSYSEVNKITHPTLTGKENLNDLDVTDLIKDMIADPENSFGFLFRLQTEQYYRTLQLASSDIEDASLHPKLVITYSANTPAICEAEVTPKGIVFPRMNTAQRNGITAKQGQCIYNTDLNAIDCYTGTEWKINCCTIANSNSDVNENQALLVEENELLKERLSYMESDLQALKKLVHQLAEKNDIPTQAVSLKEESFLKQNSPNPFNGTTKIEYYVPLTSQSANIKIFDITGKLLKSVAINNHGNGAIELRMDNYNSSIYHYSLEIDGNIISTKKMKSMK